MDTEGFRSREGTVNNKKFAEKMARASDPTRSDAALTRRFLEMSKMMRMDDTLTAKARDFLRKRILGKKSMREEEEDQLDSLEKRADIIEEMVYIKETIKKESSSLNDDELSSLIEELYAFLPDKIKKEIQFLDLIKLDPVNMKVFEELILLDQSSSKEILLVRVALIELYKILRQRDAINNRKKQERGFS